MLFIETPRFPDEIAAWLVGGRGFLTIVTETGGGNEYRNSPWEMARGVWDVSAALRTIPDGSAFAMKTLYQYFLVARSQLYGFRLKAPYDNTDDGGGVLGATGLAVAATVAYQMFKNITVSPITYQQIVQKPVGSSIKIYDNGSLRTLTTHYTIDATTGIVTFASQPTVGHALTWTGGYDIPVRFGGDLPQIGREATGALASWQGLKLVEIRLPE